MVPCLHLYVLHSGRSQRKTFTLFMQTPDKNLSKIVTYHKFFVKLILAFILTFMVLGNIYWNLRRKNHRFDHECVADDFVPPKGHQYKTHYVKRYQGYCGHQWSMLIENHGIVPCLEQAWPILCICHFHLFTEKSIQL